jgi:hypothetical protein
MKAIVLGCLLLSTAARAQTQLPNWYTFDYQPSGLYGSGNVDKFTTSGPAFVANLPVAHDENGGVIKSYDAVNSMYDNGGNLLFFIVYSHSKGYIYDKVGNIIENAITLNTHDFVWDLGVAVTEIPIIPISCNLYHAIIGTSIIQIDIATNHWTDLQTIDANAKIEPVQVGLVQTQVHDRTFMTSVAIGHVTQSSYTVFYLAQENNDFYLRSKVINKFSAPYQTAYFNQVITTIFSPVVNYSNSVSEMELSPDENLLAFSDDNAIFLYTVNTDGSPGTLQNSYTYQSYTLPPPYPYRIAGLEFDASSKVLAFSMYDMRSLTSTSASLAVWNLSSPPYYMPSTQNYGRSQIELGLDGNLYVTHYDPLVSSGHSTNLSQLSISGTPSVSTVFGQGYTLNDGTITTNTGTVECSIVTLPDQIDGYHYDVPGFDIYSRTVTGNQTWDASTFGSSSIEVLHDITLSPGATLTLQGLYVGFAPGGFLKVENGAHLYLSGTQLAASVCVGKMWQGVIVDNGGAFTSYCDEFSTDPTTFSNLIRDAVVGIDMTGQDAFLESICNMTFMANETDIHIINGARANIMIANTLFNGSVPLNDQTYGSSNGYTDGIHRTITGIKLDNCTSQIEIGLSYAAYPNTFLSQQHGIWADRSAAEIINNTFRYQKSHGVWADCHNEVKREVDIYQNLFYHTENGARIGGWVSSVIQGNDFQTTWDNAIRYLGNDYNGPEDGCTLIVGDEANPSLGNKFDYCFPNGVQMAGNASPKTRITVANNLFTNHPLATAVYAMEYSVPSSGGSYDFFHITYNEIEELPWGIKLENIAGWNSNRYQYPDPSGNGNMITGIGPMPHVTSASCYNPRSLVSCNIINYTNQTGIDAHSSKRLNILANRIVSDNPSAGNDIGINLFDGSTTAIWDNVISAGLGIRLSGDVKSSNVYCNTIDHCPTGILLDGASLRNVGETHGFGDQCRNNFFDRPGSTGFVDIELNGSNKDENQWVFLNWNQYISLNVSYVSATGSSAIIYAGQGNPPCEAGASNINEHYNYCSADPVGKGTRVLPEPTRLTKQNNSDEPEPVAGISQGPGTWIYPNPTHGSLTVEGAVKIELFDVLGKNVFSANVTGTQTVDVSTLAKGIYTIRVTAADGIILPSKLVVE